MWKGSTVVNHGCFGNTFCARKARVHLSCVLILNDEASIVHVKVRVLWCPGYRPRSRSYHPPRGPGVQEVHDISLAIVQAISRPVGCGTVCTGTCSMGGAPTPCTRSRSGFAVREYSSGCPFAAPGSPSPGGKACTHGLIVLFTFFLRQAQPHRVK